MTRIYDETSLTLRSPTFKDASGNDADPAEVTFEYAIGREGPRKVVTPESDGATGVYKVTFTPEYPGHLYGRWNGTGNVPEQSFPATVPIFSSAGVRS